jgi:hypothetical protein
MIGGNAYALYKRFKHAAKGKAFDPKTLAEFKSKFSGLKKRFDDIEKMGDKETAEVEEAEGKKDEKEEKKDEKKDEKDEKDDDDDDDEDDDDEEKKEHKEEHKEKK